MKQSRHTKTETWYTALVCFGYKIKPWFNIGEINHMIDCLFKKDDGGQSQNTQIPEGQ